MKILCILDGLSTPTKTNARQLPCVRMWPLLYLNKYQKRLNVGAQYALRADIAALWHKFCVQPFVTVEEKKIIKIGTPL